MKTGTLVGENKFNKNFASNTANGTLENATYKRITNIFIAVGLPAHINGFHFLRDAIMLAAGNFDMISGVTKKLYPLVAKRFDTTATTVEQGIRNAIAVMWNRGSPESIDSVLGVSIYKKNSRPTSAEFIALIAERVYLDCFCN